MFYEGEFGNVTIHEYFSNVLVLKFKQVEDFNYSMKQLERQAY